MNTINERLIFLLNEIFKGNVSEFARATGVPQPTLNNIVGNRMSKPSIDNLERIVNSIEIIDANWLITGKGEMYKEEIESLDKTKMYARKPDILTDIEAPAGSNYRFLPLINLDSVAGMHRTNEVVQSEAEYIIRYIAFSDVREDDMCIPITGNSMAPTCPAGSIVVVREVENWREYFGYGNIYVLVLDDGRRILKEVTKYDSNPKDYILCVSHNKSYPEEELPRKNIVGVWKVIKILVNHGW